MFDISDLVMMKKIGEKNGERKNFSCLVGEQIKRMKNGVGGFFPMVLVPISKCLLMTQR